MNNFESKVSPEPSPTIQEVKITIERFRGHKVPATDLVEVEVKKKKIAGPEFLKSILKLMLQMLDNAAIS